MARKKTPPKAEAAPWAEAVAHLKGAHPLWAAIVERVGPCTLQPRDEPFATLVRAIIGQQISSKAAATIDARLRDRAGSPHRPEALIAQGEAGLRACGLSGVKARYVLNLAEAVVEGRLPIEAFPTWDDAAIIASLTGIKGIGTWTAEMFLIFALNRPDVLSTGDLGIRSSLKRLHNLPELPNPRQCLELTESLRPFRSVALWYLWADLDTPGPPVPPEAALAVLAEADRNPIVEPPPSDPAPPRPRSRRRSSE